MATRVTSAAAVSGSTEVRGDEAAAGVPAKGGRAKIIVPVVLLVLGAIGALYYKRSLSYEDTDDAQIDGDISAISPRVNGTVVAVYVSDNQIVKAGDKLAELDPRDYQVAVDLAKAALAQAEAQYKAEAPSVDITATSNKALMSTTGADVAGTQADIAGAEREKAQAEAQLAQADANRKLAQLERDRSAKLVADGAVPKADLDQREAALEAANANVEALKQTVNAADKRRDEQRARLGAAGSRFQEASRNAPRQIEAKQANLELRQAFVESAKAQLEQAQFNLSYCQILAPADGIVGKKSINVGDRVQPGQQIFALTQTGRIWVTANFRETQVKNLKKGQAVTVHVDALDRDLHGTVDSIAGATGSRYSLLPPENATGNYVKVVQRLPVRITLDPGQDGTLDLRPGMSVEPEVRVR